MKKFILFLCFIVTSYTGYINAQDNQDFNPNARKDIVINNGPMTDATTASWSTLTVSPHAVSRSFCVYISRGGVNYLYQFGGGAGAQLQNVAVLNITTNTWTNNVSVMPFAVSAGSAIADGDSVIYVFGGNGTALGKTMKFNIGTSTWTTLTDMPTPSTDMLTLKYQDTLVYAIAGGSGTFAATTNSAVRMFKMRSATWVAMTDFPISVAMMGGGIYKDTIIATGGWLGAAPGSSATYKGVINPANPTSVTWTTIANYPTGGVTRIASAVCFIPGQGVGIACTGGAVDGGTITAASNFWNFCTQSWQTLPPNSLARSNFKGAGDGAGSMYVVGGFTTVGVGTCEKLTFTQIDGTCATGGGPTGGTISITNRRLKVIPDNGGNANPALDTINISGIPPGNGIQKITVTMDSVIHTWIGDLRLWVSKTSVTDTIISRIGWTGSGFGNSCDNFVGTRLIDTTGVLSVQNMTPTTCATGLPANSTGNFTPKSPLLAGAFLNQDPNGSYILRISDNAASDTGSLRAWTITITYGPIVGISNNLNIVEDYNLSQNYPNPFNPATKINYSLPKAGQVSIKVFDILGKEVTTLINEFQNAGSYDAVFNGANFSSGVYFYRIESGSFIDTKKMFLLK